MNGAVFLLYGNTKLKNNILDRILMPATLAYKCEFIFTHSVNEILCYFFLDLL